MRLDWRWAVFRTAEALSAAPCKTAEHGAWVVYASTLGELNAITPFLRLLRQHAPHPPLIFISEHPHYFPSFRTAWPDSLCVAIDHHSERAAAFFRTHPTAVLLLAEIPLVPGDAPARLPFAWLHHAKAAGARCALINGWLYSEKPACRIDRLERALFSRAQLQHFDLITVQAPGIRERLIEWGAPPERVHAPGNLKFDARAAVRAGVPLMADRPTVVAGSMNNAPEYALVIEAFIQLRETMPQAALIIAPRHPENTARTDQLCALLAQRGVRYRLKSEGATDAPDCLVLDTLGELAGCYAHAGAAHVGINHNVLEPLHHGRMVSVSTGWEPRYPSFAVCRAMQEAGWVVEAADAQALAAQWALALRQGPVDTRGLARFEGAGERTLQLWKQHIF